MKLNEMDVFSLVMRKGEEPWVPGAGIGLYGEAPPEKGTFFRLQVYKRVGISQVEVHKRVGKSVIQLKGPLVIIFK